MLPYLQKNSDGEIKMKRQIYKRFPTFFLFSYLENNHSNIQLELEIIIRC